MYALLRFLPRNLLSYVFGLVAAIPLPRCVRRTMYGSYVRMYDVDLRDVEKPLEEFRSLSDFFIRDLTASARPIGAGIVSPVDGTIVEVGEIHEGQLLQAKGLTYQASDLLGEANLAARYRGGYFVTLYLSPRDYHQVHSPVSGHIVRSLHIEGTLWPVNTWSTQHISGLFTVNERVVTCIESAAGLVSVIMVGATNVGSVRMTYDTIRGNSFRWPGRPRMVLSRQYSPAIPIEVGEKLGKFALGSTVILLFESNTFHPLPACRQGPIVVGTVLGETS